MKRRKTMIHLLVRMMLLANFFSDCAIVSHSFIRCRGSSLQELNQTGTLTYSSRLKVFCRWTVEQVQEPGEAIILHTKEISFPNCQAKIKLPNATAVCVRQQPFCYAYISSNSYCVPADIQRQAEDTYADCNTTEVIRGLNTLSIDFTPSRKQNNEFEIEFKKITCEYQPTSEPTTRLLDPPDAGQDTDSDNAGLLAALLVIPVGLVITAIIIFFLVPKKKHKDGRNAPVGSEADAPKYENPQEGSGT